MRRFTKIPVDTFKRLLRNAGVLCESFEPEPAEGEANVQEEDMLGATSGGVNFSAVINWRDDGEDVDGCPPNTAEMKTQDGWDIRMSGTFISLTGKLAKLVAAAADLSGEKLTPRTTISMADFKDLWYVCDYGVDGMIAIHIMNALSTGGLAIQTRDRSKGQFPFEFTAHFTLADQDTVPFEIWIDPGTEPETAAAEPEEGNNT